MSSPTVHSYTADHPHAHHNRDAATPTSPKQSGHRLSFAAPLPHLQTLTHAPALFLGSVHRHERDMLINHQQRTAKREAERNIEKYEAGFAHAHSGSTSSDSSTESSRGATGAARAAMGAGASAEDEAEWAAIVAARAAATKRSATLDLEKEMAAERQRRVLEEIEMEGGGS